MRPNGPATFVAGAAGILGLAWLMTLGGGGHAGGEVVSYEGISFVLPAGWQQQLVASPLDGPPILQASGPDGAFQLRRDAVELDTLFAAPGWEQVDVDGRRALQRETRQGGVVQRELIVDGRLRVAFFTNDAHADAADEIYHDLLESFEL